MQRLSVALITIAVASAIAAQSAGGQPPHDVAGEPAAHEEEAAKKLGERLRVLGRIQTQRNTPDYWRNVSFEEFERLVQDRRGSQPSTVRRLEWVRENGGFGQVDPIRAIERYCENPPQVVLPTTMTLTASAKQKSVLFGESHVNVLEIGITVSDAYTLQNVGDKIRLCYYNLASDDAIISKREYTCLWRNTGPWHRSRELDGKSVRVNFYVLLPFEDTRDADFSKYEWTGKDIFIKASTKHTGSGLSSTPVFRLQRTANGWSETAYSSPEYCQFRVNLDSFLRYASGIGLAEFIEQEAALTLRQFRAGKYGSDCDRFVRHYIEGPFSFPSDVKYDGPVYFVRPE